MNCVFILQMRRQKKKKEECVKSYLRPFMSGVYCCFRALVETGKLLSGTYQWLVLSKQNTTMTIWR